MPENPPDDAPDDLAATRVVSSTVRPPDDDSADLAQTVVVSSPHQSPSTEGVDLERRMPLPSARAGEIAAAAVKALQRGSTPLERTDKPAVATKVSPGERKQLSAPSTPLLTRRNVAIAVIAALAVAGIGAGLGLSNCGNTSGSAPTTSASALSPEPGSTEKKR